MREGWKEVKLGDILEIKHGYGFKGEFFKEDETDNVLVTPGNFNIGGGFKNEKLKYYDGPISEDFILKPNDVIVTMTDLSKMADTIGYSAKVPSSSKTYLHNQRIGLIKLLNDEVDIDFIYWFLRTSNYQRYVAGSSTGATVKHTSPTKIYSYKGIIPPLETQKKIASILSGYDDLIENNLKRIKILGDMAQQTYEEWFVRMRFPGHESATINPETGLPEGWEKVKLGDFINFKKGKKLEETFEEKLPDTEKVLLLDSLESGKFNYTKVGNHSLVKRGDILMLMDGARSSYVFLADDGIIGSTMAKVETKNLPSSLLFYYFQRNLEWLQINNTGAAIPHANPNFIKKIDFKLPNKELLNTWEMFIQPIWKNIWNLKDQNQRLREARDILLPRLMMGMIEV